MMKSVEQIRTELDAPDFASIATWHLPHIGISASARIAHEQADQALRADLWGANYRGRSMSITSAEARALLASGARETNADPGDAAHYEPDAWHRAGTEL